jgi:pyridoxamine 5'-phosphate oxidase
LTIRVVLSQINGMAIADLRREYNIGALRRRDLDPDPIVQFRRWFDGAAGAQAGGRLRKFFVGLYKSFMMLGGTEPPDVSAMTLATADKSGRPSARTVLLKGLDQRGFIFFTNYHSRKGEELSQNPQAALVFYWPDLEQQVCVAGTVEKLPSPESEAYFLSRPRGSQLGAWVSKQSKIVRDRAELEETLSDLEKQYAQDEVPRPPYWGGYVLSPERIEFWQGGPNRLHDRLQYTRQANGTWMIDRLSP